MSVALNNAIAIIGIGCRFPGDVRSQKDFWNLLKNGMDALGPLPFDRFDVARYWHEDLQCPATTYAPRAGLVGDVRQFDARFWGFSEKEAQNLDPQQRMVLEMTWEAFEDAGIKPSHAAGSQTAVYIGAASADMGMLHADDMAMSGPYTMTGTQLSIISNRVSYCFDFHGPSMTVDTACSSSLVALNEACRALDRGDATMAVAGGVNILLAPMGFVGFAKAHMLSPLGQCRVFDRDGKGYVRSEGGAVVLLKPLDRALSDGDSIHAVIRATAVNSDGKTAGIALPSLQAQTQLLQSIYSSRGIDVQDVIYVEAHGTGTAVGDPIEAAAIGNVLGHRDGQALYVGSVKSNIGHLETASGMAGLLKAVAVFENGVVPKNIHFDNPNPAIDFTKLGIQVPTENVPAPSVAGCSLIGVNSFGFGGTNAHVVLQKAPEAKSVNKCEISGLPLLISARSKESLMQLAQAYAHRIENRTFSEYQQLCAAVHGQRDLMSHRLYVLSDDVGEVFCALSRFARKGELTNGVSVYDRDAIGAGLCAFVFSGNGSQWVGMGQGLYAESDLFRTVVSEVDALFEPLSGWSLRDFFASKIDSIDLTLTEYAQPILFACQIGLLRILGHLGVSADAFVGHSVGEVAAAFAAGVLTLKDAVQVIYVRSFRQGQTKNSGTMAAVHLSSDVFDEICIRHKSVAVAGINAPDNYTVSGSVESLNAFAQEVRAKAGTYKQLPLSYAFHSECMQAIESDIVKDLKDIKPQKGKGFYSTVKGLEIDGTELNAHYWWLNIRETVRFSEAVDRMIDSGIKRFLEIGPHGILIGYLRTILRSRQCEGQIGYVMRRGDGFASIRNNCMKAIAAGWPIAVEWPIVARDRTLPRYAWNCKECWPKPTILSHRLFAPQKINPMLGWPVAQAKNTWSRLLDARRVSWLSGHNVDQSVLFPAAGFLEAALAAGAGVLLDKGQVTELRHIAIVKPLVLQEKVFLQIQTSVSDDGKILMCSRAAAGDAVDWLTHMQGRVCVGVRPQDSTRRFDEVSLKDKIDVDSFYRRLDALGLHYSGAFKSIRALWCQENEVIARLELSEAVSYDGMCLCVPLIDAVLQSVFAKLLSHSSELTSVDAPYLPAWFGKVTYLGEGLPAWSVARVLRVSERTLCVSFDVFDEHGMLLARFEDVRYFKFPRRNTRIEPRFYQETTRAAALPGQVCAHADDLLRQCVDSLMQSRSGHTPESIEQYRRLADLLAISYAYAAVRRFDEPLPAELVFSCDDVVEKTEYAEFLAQLLVGFGAAVCEKGLYSVASQAQIPSADLVLRTLLAQEPAYWPLWLLASSVGRHLQDLLTESMSIEDLLIQKSFSLYEQRRMVPTFELATSAVASFIGKYSETIKDDTLIRVAVVVSSQPESIRSLQESTGKNVFWTVFADETDGTLGRCESVLGHLPKLQVKSLAKLPSHQDCFDLVVVPQGIGRRKNLQNTIRELKQVLRTGGLYLALEDESDTLTNFIEGARQGWFSSDKGVVYSALPELDAWKSILSEEGFAVVLAKSGGQGISLIAARLVANVSEEKQEEIKLTHVALFCDDEDDDYGIAEAFKKYWTKHGISFEENPHSVSDEASVVVSVLDGSGQKAPTQSLKLCQKLKQTSQEKSWVLVAPTPSAWSCLRGFSRVVANECPQITVSCVGLGDQQPQSLAALIKATSDNHFSCSEIEFRDGRAFVPTVEEISDDSDAEDGFECLTFDSPGRLDRLHWKSEKRRGLQSGEVRIGVKAAGLNFRDVMWTMGLLPEDALENGFSGPTLGLEASGVVLEVGRDVKSILPGDEVLAFAPQCLASEIVTIENAVVRKPKSLSFEEAAAIPVAFFTAWYAIKEMGRARAGESVLIHGAAGGVGLAAIQIANLLGLKIYATAGSDVKRALIRSLGVENVYDSRTLSFAQEVMNDTKGQGVDLVLNSLAGDGAEKSLSVLAPFGRFLELGKRDFYADNPLFLRPFGRNLSYFGIDVDQLLVTKPDLARDLFGELMREFEAGSLRALPVEIFSKNRVCEAFGLMQASGHIGKIVVSLGDSCQRAKENLAETKFVVRSDASYIVSGGLGGLGMCVVQDLVERGARHLILLSRRGPSTDEQQHFVENLKKSGIEVKTPALDIANEDAIEKLSEVTAQMPVACGVIHAAGVIDDAMIADLTEQRMQGVWGVKVLGARHLDIWTRLHVPNLDFFVLFSSATVLLGNPGQANYVAANAAMQDLVHRRQADGLVATSIGWGPVGDTGMLKDKPKVKSVIESTLGTACLTSAEVVRAMRRAVASNFGSVHFLSVDWNRIRSLPVVASPRFESILSSVGKDEHVEGGMKALLIGKSKEESISILTSIVLSEVARLMGIARDEINVNVPVSDLGMDSLTVVELTTSLEEKLETRIPSAAMFAGASILMIAERFYQIAAGSEAVTEDSVVDAMSRQHGVALTDEMRKEMISVEQGEGSYDK